MLSEVRSFHDELPTWRAGELMGRWAGGPVGRAPTLILATLCRCHPRRYDESDLVPR